MPTARYWRINQCETYAGGDLVLSELALYAGETRIDGTATVSSTLAPITGALANLADGNFATTATFAAQDVRQPGFAIVFDFCASPQDITAVGLAGPTQAAFLHKFGLSYSSNGTTWTAAFPLQAPTVWPGGAAAFRVELSAIDQNFDKVSLLLHCNGANGSTSLVNSGPIPVAISATGQAKISTAQSKFGFASLDTTNPGGSYGSAVAPANTASLIFGTSDFAVDFFVRTYLSLQDNNYPRLLAVGNYLTHGGWNLVYLKPNGGQLILDFYANGGVALALPCGTLTDNTWHHVAFTRNGSTFRTFLDGVLQGSGTLSIDLSANNAFTISAESGQLSFFRGFFDEIRITKGIARYTANFTPPTAEFSLTNHTPDATPVRALPPVAAVQLSGGMAGNAGPVLSPMAVALDLQDAGRYRIYGTVELKGTPNLLLRRRVQLWNQRDKRIVRETWSDATTGAWSFDHIRGGDGTRYSVVTYDHTGQKQAQIADNLEPEVM